MEISYTQDPSPFHRRPRCPFLRALSNLLWVVWGSCGQAFDLCRRSCIVLWAALLQWGDVLRKYRLEKQHAFGATKQMLQRCCVCWLRSLLSLLLFSRDWMRARAEVGDASGPRKPRTSALVSPSTTKPLYLGCLAKGGAPHPTKQASAFLLPRHLSFSLASLSVL